MKRLKVTLNRVMLKRHNYRYMGLIEVSGGGEQWRLPMTGNVAQ